MMKLQAYVLVVCIITTYHFTLRSRCSVMELINVLHGSVIYVELLQTYEGGKKTSVAI